MVPILESVFGIDQTVQGLDPRVKITEIFREKVFELSEQGGRLNLSIKHVHINIALDNFEGIVEGLGISSSDLSHFLFNYRGFLSVHYGHYLVNPSITHTIAS